MSNPPAVPGAINLTPPLAGNEIVDLVNSGPQAAQTIVDAIAARAFAGNASINGGTIKITLGANPLVLNGNTGTVPTPTSTAALQIIGGDAMGINVDGYGYSGGFFYQGWRSGGTQAAPTAAALNDTLVGVGGWGFDGAGFGTVVPADFIMRGAETFTTTAHGTYMVWRVTPTGSITKAEAMRLQASGILSIGATAASGAAKLQVTGGTSTDTLAVSGNAGFFGTPATTKPTVTGSRGGNAALASLLTALAGLGLIVDSSS